MNLHDLKLRARALLRPHRVEQELHEELAFHIEREVKKDARVIGEGEESNAWQLDGAIDQIGRAHV